MASKLQVFKVYPCWDLNPDQPRESLNIGKLTHAGGPGSNPRQGKLWRHVILKPLKLQQWTLHFWKSLIFFYLDKRSQDGSCMFINDMLLGIPIGLLHKIAIICDQKSLIGCLWSWNEFLSFFYPLKTLKFFSCSNDQ